MAKTHYIIPFFVPHEGCPHDCVFCNQKAITGSLRGREPNGECRDTVIDGPTEQAEKENISSQVADKIKTYLATMPQEPEKPGHPAQGIRVEVAFYGGSFTGITRNRQAEYLEPAKAALEAGMIHGIRISTRPDYIDSQTLEFLASHGVSTIELGVQSMDPEVLKAANRGHSRNDVIEAVGLIRTSDTQTFTLGLQMMVGLPGDTPEKSLATARDLAGLKPDFVRIYPTLIIEGTALERMYQLRAYQPPQLEEAVETCAQILKLFLAAGIPVIRIGLQPSEEIREGASVVAGPFHPAFRELVEGRLAREKMAAMLGKLPDSREITFLAAPRDISMVLGPGRSNVAWLEQKFGVKVKVKQDSSLVRGEIKISGKNGE